MRQHETISAIFQFYGIMCLVYLGFGVAWIVLSACHWRDLLRVQFWIGAVILLGKLVFLPFLSPCSASFFSSHFPLHILR